MGKFEVLDYLRVMREDGLNDYLRYREIHEGLRAKGQSFSYTSVWRSLNSLYTDGLVEVRFSFEGLQRVAYFRARISSVHTSQMKRVNNIHLNNKQTPLRQQEGRDLALARATHSPRIWMEDS